LSNVRIGMISGLAATVFTGSMLLMNNALHAFPGVHITRMLASLLGSDNIMVGVAGILVIGVAVFGALFPYMAPKIPVRTYFAKGLLLGAATWLGMMLVFMPLGGEGLFGMNGSSIVAPVTLVLSLVYWTVLVLSYQWLTGQPQAVNDEERLSLESTDRG